jgi:hypothetical protein
LSNSLLAEIIACPPEEPVPKQLLMWRRHPSYNPEAWRRTARGYSGNHILGYRQAYSHWVHEAVAWVISPELEANHLRQQLHTGALPDLPVHVELDDATFAQWPDGLFMLVDGCCQPPQGGHHWTMVDTPQRSKL